MKRRPKVGEKQKLFTLFGVNLLFVLTAVKLLLLQKSVTLMNYSYERTSFVRTVLQYSLNDKQKKSLKP